MTNKKRNILIVSIVICVLLFFVYFSNSKSNLIRQLQGPIEGTDNIFAIGNNLSIVSKNNHIYTWQWDNFKKWPVVAKPHAEFVVPLNDNKIVYAAKSELVLTDLKAEKELASLSLPYGTECKKIAISSNGKFGLLSLSEKDKLKLALFNSEFKELPIVFEKNTTEEKFTLFDYAIDNEGSLIVGAGKKDKAWIFVKDIKNDKILWEKTFDEYGQFTIVEFSSDGKTLYVAEKIRFIIALDAITGNILRVYEMPKYNTPANQKQNISSIKISPDSKILAVDTEPARRVWFWDIATGEKLDNIYASDLTVSDMAFSPDSKYIATGCLVSPEIKIWKVPTLKDVK
ncbi:MAG: WD40 repeat domain-containing protein [Planctomycetaceae bacterium]|nr:WD40 repeat domain-containing protein [Planctomycetaceae bacterium]